MRQVGHRRASVRPALHRWRAEGLVSPNSSGAVFNVGLATQVTEVFATVDGRVLLRRNLFRAAA